MKKIGSLLVLGLIGMIFVGCGPQKLNLQPNMQKVMNMSKKDAVSYLSSVSSGSRCEFKEDYLTINDGNKNSKKYKMASFVGAKSGSEYRISLIMSNGKHLSICHVYRGNSSTKAQRITDSLDKLGVIIQ